MKSLERAEIDQAAELLRKQFKLQLHLDVISEWARRQASLQSQLDQICEQMKLQLRAFDTDRSLTTTILRENPSDRD